MVPTMKIELTQEQQELFKDIRKGQYEEHHLVKFIKDVLLTEDQKKELYKNDMDITDLLNGRFTKSEDFMVYGMYKDWNEKVGEHMFGC